MMKRLIAGILLSFITLIFSVLFFLLATEPGLKYTLHLARKFVPGQLEYQNVQGKLLGPIKIEHLRYADTSLVLDVRNIQLHWHLGFLLFGKLHISELKAHSLWLNTLSSANPKTQPETSPRTDSTLPIQITLKRAVIQNIRFSQDDHTLVTAKNIRLSGDTYYQQEESVHLHLNWDSIQYAVKRKTALHSNQGELSLAGPLSNYQLSLETSIALRTLPPIHGSLKGTGNLSYFNLQRLFIHASDGGMVTAQGRIQWDPEMSWDLNLHAQNLNPAVFLQDMPGKINFSMASAGAMKTHDLRMRLQLQQLSGTLDQQALSGEITLNVRNQHFSFSPSQLQYGDAKLWLQGGRQNHWNLQWELSIPDFHKLHPAAAGSLFSNGTLSGVASEPVIKAVLNARQLVWQSYSLKQFQGNISLNTSASGRADIHLQADDIQSGKFTLQRFSVDSTGTSTNHRTQIRALGATDKLSIRLNGTLAQQNWRGMLTQFQFESKRLGNWSLAKAASLQLSQQAIHIGEICLNNANQSLCTRFTWEPLLWQWQFRASNLLLNHWLQALASAGGNLPASISSQINAAVNLENSRGKLGGDFNVRLTPGAVRYSANGSQEITQIQSGNIKGVINQQGLNIDAAILLSAEQKIIAFLKIPNFNKPGSKQPLEGGIRVNFHDFQVIPNLYPKIQTLRGNLSADIQIGGTLKDPEFQGQANLANAYLAIPDYGLSIQNINLRASGNQAGFFTLQGSAESGPGKLQLQGKLLFNEAGLPASLSIDGKNFTVIHNAEYSINLSPRIRIQKTSNNIVIQGDILIPQAEIRPKDFGSGSVALSSDVVFVSNEAKKRQIYNISGNIHVILGDSVSIDTYGVKGKAKGNLAIAYKTGTPTTAAGSIRIVQGVYDAYGQQLQIRTGKLLYTSGPINNPGVDVAAVRSIITSQTPQSTLTGSLTLPTAYSSTQTVIVGLQVSGTLKNHQITLFSDPPIYSQSDILSLLLTGKTLEDISSNKGQLLLQAASALNLGGETTGNLTSQLQQSFGLDELGFGTETIDGESAPLQTTALMIGKHITKRLYISYSLGLLDPVSIFRARFMLTRNWNIQTQASSQATGIDLFYYIEK